MPATHRVPAPLTWVLAFAAGASAVPAAWAQDVTTTAKWELDVHAGVITPAVGARGASIAGWPSSGTFAAGSGVPTRAVSSWFFGEGAVLFNQASAALSTGTAIAPLDAALLAPSARRRGGINMGLAVARWLWPRLAVDMQGDYVSSGTEMHPRTLGAIEATATSYPDAWDRLLQRGVVPGGASSDVSVAGDADRGRGHQFFFTAGVKAIVHARRRIRTYVGGGVGVVREFARRAPSASLVGIYAFRSAARTASGAVLLIPFVERDELTLRVRLDEPRKPAGAIRGGVEYYLDATRGFRFDVTAFITAGRVETAIDVTPAVLVQEPGGVVSTPTNPALQFSSLPPDQARSSLSGPALEDVVTFRQNGPEVQIKMSAAYFLRF